MTTRMSDFDIDLQVGKEGEVLVQQLLTNGKTIEVKRDMRWKDTGNLFIETECWYTSQQQWGPSGLSVTKAEYWAFVLEGVVLMVPTDVLKKTIVAIGRPISNNMPPNPSKGYLITVQDLLDIARVNAQQK